MNGSPSWDNDDNGVGLSENISKLFSIGCQQTLRLLKKLERDSSKRSKVYSLTGAFCMIKIHAWNMCPTPASGYHHFCWIFKWVSTCCACAFQYNANSEV